MGQKGNITFVLFGLALVSLIFGQPAYSSPILGAMSGFSGIITVSPNPATNMSALIAVGPVLDSCFVVGVCPKIALLEGIDFSTVGTSYILNPASADFAGVVATFTNGSLDKISGGIVPGPFYGTSSGRATAFYETIFGTSPDFAGQTIGSIGLHIDGVTIQPDAFSPGTVFRPDYSLTVYGADVPEPASWLMLASGGVALSALRRKRSLLKGRSC